MAKPPKKSGIPPSRSNTVIHNIADVRAPFLEVAIVNTVKGFTGSIPTKTIEELLGAGAFNAIDTAIPWRELHEALRDGLVSEEIVRGLTQSADKVAADTAKIVKQATGMQPLITFDSQSPYIRKFLNVQIGELITSVTQDSRDSVKQIVESSRFRQTTAAEVAAQIKSVVGLRPDQTKSLTNYIDRLTKEGKPKSDIKKLAALFADQKLKERANLIARTEMMTAVNGGHSVGWDQAAAEGYFDPDKAKVRWVVINDGLRLCPTCESMEDIPRPFKGVWKVEMLYRTAGGVKKAGRTKAVKIPSQTHPNCRCTMTLDLSDEDNAV